MDKIPTRLAQRVVVTGLGIVSPLGTGVPRVWERLLEGATGIRALKPTDFPESHRPSFKELRTKGGRAGQIIAQGRPDQLPGQLLARLLLGSPSAIVASEHGLQGPIKTHTTACSAGAHAIGDAWRHIRDGDADIMVAGGAESCIDAITIAGFANMRAMSTDTFWQPGELSRPFDNRRSGFVMGEGAAVLVMENMDHAQARGARMYAEVRSCGMSGDAHHAVQPDPGGYGALTAMRSALELGGIAPDQVKYLNAHAASTPIGDALEQLAISKAFGDWATKGKARECLQGIVGPKGPAQLPAGPIAVMSNSFGFGGTNAALLLTTPPCIDDW
ncbi:hypothetical protein WJX73_004168 [Symbiochloris irregularis]|uniref:beta-ketoacyl-[acyl-carrier-protein] synthase I n=1 Tax=Symbiochloris irregularis TaxID=706552 RepID=A0AAW1P977_9CHLO